MEFELSAGIAVLERTPGALRAQLNGLPHAWTAATEGPETWSPRLIVAHLLHCEKNDWMVRAGIILNQGTDRRFASLDRFAHVRDYPATPLEELLPEFATARAANLAALADWKLKDAELALEGQHPTFGTVTLSQLLATWVAHDLSHLAQVARVMAKQYANAVGPWRAYLPIMDHAAKPTDHAAASLNEALKNIRLVALDVDGVLTDGGIYLGASEELKRFEAKDGAGIAMLRKAGLTVALITGRQSTLVERRAKELNITEVHQGVKDKVEVLREVCQRLSIAADQVAYMGDDLPDMAALRWAGVGAAPADAVAEVQSAARWVSTKCGGGGAVRELAEAVLKAHGTWGKTVQAFEGERMAQ